MKIVAKIHKATSRNFLVEQPREAHDVPDRIIARHIGPRPWSETFYVNDAGNKVCGYHT